MCNLFRFSDLREGFNRYMELMPSDASRLAWGHTIRKGTFLSESLQTSYFGSKYGIIDYRHVQLVIAAFIHEECESAVRIAQFRPPEEKIEKKQPTRVSTSYGKMSYGSAV